jgi:hypothetical protein
VAVNRDRLQEFETLLRNIRTTLPDLAIFNMSTWYEPDFDATRWKSSNSCFLLLDEKVTCGSAACALGSAAIHKPFIEQGLIMNSHYDQVQFGSDFGFEAGAEFFDLTIEQAKWLFFPLLYSTEFIPEIHSVHWWVGEEDSIPIITPEMVADRVKQILDGTAPEFLR